MIHKFSARLKLLPILMIPVLLVLLALPGRPEAGVFKVTPIRLEFDPSVKTGLVTVFAEGPGSLNIQMKAYEWTQDAEGKDVYTETPDLIFFPRMATIQSGAERSIRAGTKVPAAAMEKTYRLFIEELPERRKDAGANVAMAIRFGLPIFVRPVKEEPSAEITETWFRDGSAGVRLDNTGNVHLVVTSIDMTGTDAGGAEVFTQKLGGWYLLAGASRPYSATVPEEACSGLESIKVEIATDRLSLEAVIDADNAGCAR